MMDRRCLLALLALMLSMPAAALWRPDATFGDGGRVRAGFDGPGHDEPQALAVLPDGRYYTVGGSSDISYLSRHLADGRLDPAFGSGGAVAIAGFFGNRVATLADGRILVAGVAQGATTQEDFALARYLPDGTRDTTFGQGGLRTTDFQQRTDVPLAIAVAADGTIVLAGRAVMPAFGSSGLALARYDAQGNLLASRATKLYDDSADIVESLAFGPDGQLYGIGLWRTFTAAGSIVVRVGADLAPDPAFGSAGVALLPIGVPHEAYAGSVGADGRIVIGGLVTIGNRDRMLLARLLPSGAIDTSFGDGGWREAAFPGQTEAYLTGLVQAGGRIIATARPNALDDFAIVGFTMAGALDAGYGDGGVVRVDFHGGIDHALAIAVHGDGVLVAGSASSGGPALTEYGFVRLRSDATLDPAFGSGGRAEAGFGAPVPSRATAVAALPDGRVVSAGHAGAGFTGRNVAITRHLADGRLDPSFGTGGRVTTDIAGGEDAAAAIALQADQRLVVAGLVTSAGNRRIGVMRYLADGSADPGFGSGGIAIVDGGILGSEPPALALQADGRIVVAATAYGSGGSTDFLVLRLTAAGQLDTGFGNGGRVLVNPSGGRDFATALQVRGDGSILVAGSGGTGTNLQFQLAGLNGDGSPLAGFGSGGSVAVDFEGGADVAYAMTVVGSGAGQRIHLAGSAVVSGATRFAVATLDASGALVPGFGSGGKATFAFGPGTHAATALIADTQRLILAGYGPQGDGSDFQLLALRPDGQPDATFGAAGARLTVDFDGRQDEAAALARDPSGRLLVAGWTWNGQGQGGQRFGLVRLAEAADTLFADDFDP